jgi:hypothetical protein
MSNFRPKAVFSLVLTLMVASVFTLSSFAASNTTARPSGETAGARAARVLDAPAGMLTGTGRLTIDGYDAPSGTTVMSGSTVAVGPNSNARLTLGSLGYIELRPNTTVTVLLAPDNMQVHMNGAGLTAHSFSPAVCDVKILGSNNRLAVARGQVKVEANGNEWMLDAGSVASFNQPSEARSTGDAVFTAESADPNAPPPAPDDNKSSPGWYGVAGMIGLAGGVALGIMLGSNDDDRTTLPKPSTVVP